MGDSCRDAPGVLLVGHQIAPGEKVVDRERAGAPHRGQEIVRTRGNDGRGQFRWRILQHRPLGESQIRQSDSGESTGEPGLLTQPCHRVSAVGDLVDHRLEDPARPERPAHALQHDVVAAGRVWPGKGERERKTTSVRPADQHGADGCGGRRCVVVGHQLDPIAHRDLDPIHGVVGGRPWQAQQSPYSVAAGLSQGARP